MNRQLFIQPFRLLVLIALQVLILNNVQLFGFINPFLYIYLILVWPVDFSPNLGLVFGFLLGLIIDMFTETLGMHTISTVFLAYCRPFVLQYMAPRDGYESARYPSIYSMSVGWFLTYASILIFLHHFLLYFVEVFQFQGFWFTMLKAFTSSVFTLVLVMLTQLIFGKNSASGSPL